MAEEVAEEVAEDQLVRTAADSGAPEGVRAQLAGLPSDRSFGTIYEIWEALGHRNEA